MVLHARSRTETFTMAADVFEADFYCISWTLQIITQN